MSKPPARMSGLKRKTSGNSAFREVALASGTGGRVMKSAVTERFPVYGSRATSHYLQATVKAITSMKRVWRMPGVPARRSGPGGRSSPCTARFRG